MQNIPDGNCRSWFCVFNNPREHGFKGTEQEICDAVADLWLMDNPQRTCAVIYCVSADGLEHCHVVLEDTKTMRFSTVKKVYPSMHIEPTKGNKEQAEDYINKRGKWEEKGEKVLAKTQHGEIKGVQGQRRDIEIISEMLEAGKTPREILELSFGNYRYETSIRKAYFAKRDKETPFMRDLEVYYHVGESGSGKSYTSQKLINEYGEYKLFVMSNYENGLFDGYNGEQILFMDEFRGHMKFSLFLKVIDVYKGEFPARYSNIKGLWNQVHITSVLPPEALYSNMVKENQHIDSIQQLKRRITYVVYHYIDEDGKYQAFHLPMSEYTDYETLKLLAIEASQPEQTAFDFFGE
ncbi:MAG: hypothetical protein LBS74_02395 [Oscillospiraceae bacterium]|nr:hypothetical protein [Oscillospiraceae bacterium]